MKIMFTEEASNNFDDILDYISKDSVANAIKVRKDILKAIDYLIDFPESGMKPKIKELNKKGYRFLIVDNYLIFYVIKDYIEIRYIMHGGRLYKNIVE